MTLRRRTAFAVLVACIVAVIALYFAAQSILTAHSATLERQKANQDLELASNALNLDVASLETAVGVWAPWDDTYRFVQDGNADYIASNLNTPTLQNLGLDFVVYVDSAGQIFYSKAIDADGADTSIPSGLEQFVTGEGLLARHPSETSSVAGILFLPEHLALAASQPILTSQKQGPIAGSLVMGRYLDSDEVQRLSEMTDLSIGLYRVDESDIPTDFQEARSKLSDVQTSVIMVLNSRTIASYRLASEIHGSPAFVLGVSEPREIYAQAQRTARNILYLLLGLSGLFTLLFVLEVDTLVMHRLRRLTTSIAAAGQNRSFSDRVSVGGRDEVAAVAEVVNATLASLEQSHHDLVESEARYQALVAAVPDLVFRITKEGRITETRRPQRATSLADNHGMPDDVMDLIPTQIQQIAIPYVVRALESGELQILEFQLTVDGRESYHEARVLPCGDNEALVMVRDVTAQKHEEEARQNTLVLKEIHSRIKSHLQVIRSFPEGRRRQAASPSIGARAQAESAQQRANVADDKRSTDDERGEPDPVGTTTQVK